MAKQIKRRNIVIKPTFTKAELNDLESYITNAETDRVYWDNKNYFEKRKAAIRIKIGYMRKAL